MWRGAEKKVFMLHVSCNVIPRERAEIVIEWPKASRAQGGDGADGKAEVAPAPWRPPPPRRCPSRRWPARAAQKD
eukprot:4942490-Pleurochrysis_carterae.AAC.1